MAMGCCRICSGLELNQLFDFGMVPAGHRFLRQEQAQTPTPTYPLELVQCLGCGLVQLCSEGESLWDSGSRHADERDVADNCSRRLAEAIFRRLRPGLRDWVVEVCGERPAVLSGFWRRGCRVLAVEPLPFDGGRPKARGLETLRETFDAELASDLRSQFGPASLLIANDVLPFLGRPLEFLQGVQRLLADDGVAVFEVPHLSLITNHLEFDRIMHERPTYYSLAALEAAAVRVGLRTLDVDAKALQQGVLRAWFGREDGDQTVYSGVATARQLESTMQLDRMRTWRLCGRRIEQVRERIKALFDEATARDMCMAGYGGSCRAANLLNLCRIRPEQLMMVVDPLPQRQGMLMPGLQLTIQTPEQLAVRCPDQVLILNGERASDLTARHGEYVRRGGRFVEAATSARSLAYAA